MIDRDTSREIRLLERDSLSKIIQLLTGHGFNKYHLGQGTDIGDMSCRFCNECDREDTWHIVNECKSLDSIRRNADGTGITVNFPQDVMRLTRLFDDIDSLFHPLGTE